MFLQQCKRIFILTLFLLSFAVFSSPKKSPDIEATSYLINLAIIQVSYDKYRQYMHQDYCLSPPNSAQEQVDRVLIEVLLMCNSFKYAGYDLKINFIPSPSYMRSLWMLKLGYVHTLATSVWTNDAVSHNQHFYATIDVLQLGEFEKGIYVHEKHELLNKNAASIELSKYTGISLKSWLHDWKVINSLTPTIIEAYLPSLFKMMASHRADFTLMEFPSQSDLSIQQDNIILKPLEGIKVIIPDSRKLVVSKQSANAEQIFTILNNGLQKMRNNGEIYPLYVESGFINHKTKKWTVLNPH